MLYPWWGHETKWIGKGKRSTLRPEAEEDFDVFGKLFEIPEKGSLGKITSISHRGILENSLRQPLDEVARRQYYHRRLMMDTRERKPRMKVEHKEYDRDNYSKETCGKFEWDVMSEFLQMHG